SPVILLTGFAPFAGEAVNPSWQAVRELDGEMIEGHRVVAVELPTEFESSLRGLQEALRATQPRMAIAVGLAGGREGISLERVAINVIDARIPDNAGAQPVDVPVVGGGPAAYFSTLPIKAALAALQRADIEAHISQTAGTYVCNYVFYALMHAARRSQMRAGFVHVPFLPEQVKGHQAPGMPLERIVEGLRIIARIAVSTRTDVRMAGGAES
ncbi:MAG TPA: pyroglutamyl-peptidase I, partial [Rhodanobacteraceae bacterium]|nr:pyroglutamyl-peptidase I [Rhodanobacteraceae bacterium]